MGVPFVHPFHRSPMTIADSVTRHLVDLYRRTMDGADCEIAQALVGTVQLRVVRHFGDAELVIEPAPSTAPKLPAPAIAKLVLPRRGVFCGYDTDVADEVQDALPRIAKAALAITKADGTSRLQSAGADLDALGLLVRIFRECAASQVEAERLEQVAAAELDGGAA